MEINPEEMLMKKLRSKKHRDSVRNRRNQKSRVNEGTTANVGLGAIFQREFERLNKEQKAVVEACDNSFHVLVLAQPGTGKTTMLRSVVLGLVSNVGIFPNEILNITHTNTGCLMMKKNLMPIKEVLGKNIATTNFHGFSDWIFRTMMKKSRVRSLLSNNEVEKRLEKIVSENSLWKLRVDISNADIIHQQRVNRYCENILDVPPSHESKLLDIYERFLLENEVVDNTQKLIDLIELLQNPSGNEIKVCEQLLKKYKIILCDEGQDLSKFQLKILSLFRNSTVVLVGDDGQFMYSFHGSHVSIREEFVKLFPKSKKLKLSTNYRCHPSIQTAYQLFRGNINESSISTSFEKRVSFTQFDNIEVQHEAVASTISFLSKTFPGRTIGVVSRTSLALWSGKKKLKLHKTISKHLQDEIKFSIRSKNDFQKEGIIEQQVVFSTIAQFKGDEKDFIILCDFSEGFFPRYDRKRVNVFNGKQISTETIVEENSCYMIMSRPRHFLFLFAAMNVTSSSAYKFMQKKQMKVSSFYKSFKTCCKEISQKYFISFLEKEVSKISLERENFGKNLIDLGFDIFEKKPKGRVSLSQMLNNEYMGKDVDVGEKRKRRKINENERKKKRIKFE